MSFFKLPDQTTIFYDVDDTLILHKVVKTEENEKEFIKIQDPHYECTHEVVPHKEHIQSLKDNSKAGHNIIVWSGGGSDWASAVIKTLGLNEYVDVIVNKPDFWYDDVESEEVLYPSFRIWKEPK